MTARVPTDGLSESDQAFAQRLAWTNVQLDRLSTTLRTLAEDLDGEEPLDPDWLIDMARRQALASIRDDVLSACHDIEGARIGILRARPQVSPPRAPRGTGYPSGGPSGDPRRPP